MNAPDAIANLEHDHVELSALVDDLGRILEAAEPAAQHSEFLEKIRQLRDELLHHFAKEEEGVFPFIVEHIPAMAEVVDKLSETHDGLCGLASRLTYIAQSGPDGFARQLPAARTQFGRFVANYRSHAQMETQFLRQLGSQLAEGQRRQLQKLLAEL